MIEEKFMRIELEKIIKETIQAIRKMNNGDRDSVNIQINQDTNVKTNIDATASLIVYSAINDVDILFSFIEMYSNGIDQKFRKTSKQVINEKINSMLMTDDIYKTVIKKSLEIYRDLCIDKEVEIIDYLVTTNLDIDQKYKNKTKIVMESIIKGMNGQVLNVKIDSKNPYVEYAVNGFLEDQILMKPLGLKSDYSLQHLENIVFLARSSDLLKDGLSECYVSEIAIYLDDFKTLKEYAENIIKSCEVIESNKNLKLKSEFMRIKFRKEIGSISEHISSKIESIRKKTNILCLPYEKTIEIISSSVNRSSCISQSSENTYNNYSSNQSLLTQSMKCDELYCDFQKDSMFSDRKLDRYVNISLTIMTGIITYKIMKYIGVNK
jgi:hypothetical protein